MGETGTPHLQGYIESRGAVGFTTWKGRLGHRAHIEAATSCALANFRYCSKDGNVIAQKPVGSWTKPEESRMCPEGATKATVRYEAFNTLLDEG